ncbi:MAG: glycosyltransferase family 39 protein [Acidobacteriota bacterium]
MANGVSVPALTRRSPTWLLCLWLLAWASAAALGLSVGGSDLIVALIVASGLLALGRKLARKLVPDQQVFAANLFTGAFLVRFVCASVVLSAIAITGINGLEGGNDYLLYESMGWRLAEHWRAGQPVFSVPDSDPGFYYLVASIYTLTGRHLIAPILIINGFFGSLTAIFAFLIARRLFGARAAVVSGYLGAFLPTLLFWSSLLYKDVLLAAAVSFAVYQSLELNRARSVSQPAWLALSLLPLFMIRPETGMVVLAGCLLYLVASAQLRLSRAMPLIVTGALLLAGLFALETYGLGGKTPVLERFQNPVEVAGQSRETWTAIAGGRAEGFSRMLYGADLLSRPHLFVLALGMVFVIPIPGSGPIGMNFWTFLTPGQLAWLFLLPAFFYGVVFAIRRRTSERLFVLGLSSAFALGVVVAGYFSNPRYLVQTIPLLLIFVSVGLSRISRWWQVYGILLCAVGMIAVFYLLIR